MRGLGMPDLESYWLAERLANLALFLCGEEIWESSFLARNPIPRPKVAEGRRRPRDEAPFTRECHMALRNLSGPSDLSRPRKELYREVVVGSASDPLVERLGWLLGEIRSEWNWTPCSSFLNNFEFSLTWWLDQKALPLNGWAFRACLADIPCCGSGLEETNMHAFYYCE